MKLLSNEKGQSLVEAVLLMSLFIVVVTLVSNGLKDNKTAARLIGAPWERLDNMIRYGHWGKDAVNHHPNQHDKHGSSLPN